ncbi:GDP-mannose 4,6-dehydratase [Candidatus Pelagibacter sp.]|nr:GDP-mannose 4,6-dehydratase [Candidatus Pelagibacter sp.]
MRKFKKCLITGITGSGGSYLAEFINKTNSKIQIFGTKRNGFGYSNLLDAKIRQNISKVDLTDLSKTHKLLKKIKPDLIFHFASDANVRKSFDEPYEINKNNIFLTLNLLEVLRRLKSKALIVICSTSEVYGQKRSKKKIREDSNLEPINPYAASKTYQDLLAQVFQKCYNLNIIISRMFSYTNARRLDLFQAAFANQIIKIKYKKKKYLEHGNLKSLRSFIDIDDAMNAYWNIATKGKIGEIYNVSGNSFISVGKFLNKLIMHSGVKVKKKLNKKLLRLIDIKFQIPSSDKIKKHTGWTPKIKLDESMSKLLQETENLYIKNYYKK